MTEPPERIWTYGHKYIAYETPDDPEYIKSGDYNFRTEYIRADIAEAVLPDAMLTITALRAEIDEYAADNAALRKFAREMIMTYCWDLADPAAERQFDTDGGHIQDLAEKLGLIEPRIATAGDCDDESDFGPGDTVYVFTAALKE